MKLQDASEHDLMSWMQGKASIASLSLLDLKPMKDVCKYLRVNFPAVEMSDMDKAFNMWMMGDLPNVRKSRTNALDAFLIGQILGDFRRGSGGFYGKAESRAPVIYVVPEHEKQQILADGYENVKADFLDGVIRGWIFLTTLYNFASERGYVMGEYDADEIEAQIVKIDQMIKSRKHSVIMDRLALKMLKEDSTPHEQKQIGAKVAFSFEEI